MNPIRTTRFFQRAASVALLALQLPAVVLLSGCAGQSLNVNPNAANALALASSTAQTVLKINTAVPAEYKAKLADLVTKYLKAHPASAPKLETVANALESVAGFDAKLPDPNGAINTLLLTWGGAIPDVGPFIQSFVQYYKLAYPYLLDSGTTLTELGELIRSFEPVKATAAPGVVAVTPASVFGAIRQVAAIGD